MSRLRGAGVLVLLAAGCGDASRDERTAQPPDAVARAAAPADSCFEYERDTVTITGRLEQRTYPGPPNYGERPDDTPETGYYVVPDAPLCTRADADSMYWALNDVRLVQLVLDSAGYARAAPLLGTRIRASGTVFGAHTGHHHAPLLMSFPAVQPVR